MADAGGQRAALLVPEGQGGDRVLAVADGDGVGPPSVDLPDTWWVGHATALLDAVREQLELSVSLVDTRRTAEGRYVAAVTAPPPGWEPPDSARWVDRDELTHSDVAVFDKQPSAAPWLRQGWFNDVVPWIDEQLGAIGRRRTGPVVQFKHWSIGSLLRVPAEPNDVFFKEVPPFMAHEVPVISVLRDVVPRAVPEPIAVEGGRWLMEEFTVDLPDGAAHPDYDAALRAAARVQMAAVDRVDALRAAGAPSRMPAELADELQALLQRPDVDEIFPGESRATFEDALPELTGRCHALEALGLPLTISHGDLHQTNVTRSGGRWLIYDWTDASISVPLLDLCPWLWHMTDEAARRRAADAYLDEWSAVIDPVRLREAWRVAEPVAAAFYAMDFLALVDGVDPWHEGMWRGAVGVWTGRAVDALRTQDGLRAQDDR